MIVTGDIYEIFYEKVQEFGIKAVHDSWNPITSELKEEAVVIVISTPIEPDTYWENAVVHVNICVPDYLDEVNKIRLQEIERMAKEWTNRFRGGEYDNSRYSVKRKGLGIERDDALKCSYVNIKLLFKILNVR